MFPNNLGEHCSVAHKMWLLIRKTHAQRQLNMVGVEVFCLQLLFSVEVPKHFASTIVRGQKFSSVSAHFN